MDLKESEGNAFWATARRENVEEKMRAEFGLADFAVQGELIGPGIQGNIYKLSEPMFYVFDIYDIRRGEYVDPATRSAMVKSMELNHVPVIWHQWKLDADVDTLLAQAEGSSWLNKAQEREGIVFKQLDGGMTFKAISNKYLLGEK
jgi:ATP-dependent RNA circularization protein (DNA/RNA ligase family)